MVEAQQEFVHDDAAGLHSQSKAGQTLLSAACPVLNSNWRKKQPSPRQHRLIFSAEPLADDGAGGLVHEVPVIVVVLSSNLDGI